MPRRLAACLALLALACAAVLADAVRLTSGEVLQGKTARTKEGALALQDAEGKVRTFPGRDVVWVLEGKDWERWQERLVRAKSADTADGWFEAAEWATSSSTAPRSTTRPAAAPASSRPAASTPRPRTPARAGTSPRYRWSSTTTEQQKNKIKRGGRRGRGGHPEVGSRTGRSPSRSCDAPPPASQPLLRQEGSQG